MAGVGFVGVNGFAAAPVGARSRSGVSLRPRPACRTARMALDVNVVNDTFIQIAENNKYLMVLVDQITALGLPKVVVKWGHPFFMTVMVTTMGFGGALIGWKGRVEEDKKKGAELKRFHESVMTAFWALAFFGGFGGTLSTAQQGYDIWQSPHFISACVVLGLLTANAFFAWSGFGGSDPKSRLQGRTYHAYLGAATMAAFVVHGALGVMRGLSIDQQSATKSGSSSELG